VASLTGDAAKKATNRAEFQGPFGGMTPEEAKALMAGSLGEEMAKFPVRFATPLYFGAPPSPEYPVDVNNGTASLLKRCDDHLVVTCSHVIAEYRCKRKEVSGCLFAVGNCYFDPLAQILAEDSVIDFAILQITPEQAKEITQGSDGIGETFYELNPNSPTPVKVGDFVAYGGFPGETRQLRSLKELNFGSYSSGACRVTDVYSDYITCEFEREYWIKHFPEAEPESLGGLSGGPAFLIHYGPASLMSYEYAGLIYQMHKSTESLYIRQAHAVPLDWKNPASS
jgi:hypothetical protein